MSLFIAGSWTGDNQGSEPAEAVARQWCPKTSTATRGNLPGVKVDIANYRETLVGRNAWFFGDRIKYLEKPGTELRKQEVVESLIELFRDPNEEFHKCVFYCGHGKSFTGDWCFENEAGEVVEFITFDEVWNLFQTHAHSKFITLTLVLDCCHSGAWVNRAHASGLERITVIAACRNNELASEDELGGAFTQAFIDRFNGGETELYTRPDEFFNGGQHPQFYFGPTIERLGV